MEVERREKARGQEEGANKGTRGIEGSGQGRGGDRWWVWSGEGGGRPHKLLMQGHGTNR